MIPRCLDSGSAPSGGVRVLLLVQPAGPGEDARFLRFETLTLAPFDRALIDPALLSPVERDWIDRYHRRVLAEIGPELPEPTRAWLASACAPLTASPPANTCGSEVTSDSVSVRMVPFALSASSPAKAASSGSPA